MVRMGVLRAFRRNEPRPVRAGSEMPLDLSGQLRHIFCKT